MLDENTVRDIVDATIRRTERLGDQAGGSGHVSFVSYTVDSIEPPRQVGTAGNEEWEIGFVYTKVIETEFTIYPDNPPYEERYRKTIVVDPSGRVLREGGKERDSSSTHLRPPPPQEQR